MQQQDNTPTETDSIVAFQNEWDRGLWMTGYEVARAVGISPARVSKLAVLKKFPVRCIGPAKLHHIEWIAARWPESEPGKLWLNGGEMMFHRWATGHLDRNWEPGA